MDTSVSQPEEKAKKKFRMPKFRHKKLLFLLAVVIIAVIVVVYVVLPRQQAKNAVSAEYTEADVAVRDIHNSLTGSGTLTPANSYTVTVLRDCDILSDTFSEGDIVTKDQVLYELDSSDVDNNLEKAQISVNQAERNYQDAQDKRYIKSTAAGTVFSLEVEVGDTVSQGQTIATIRDSSTMKLKVPFPSDDAKKFYVGQAATVTLDGSFEVLNGTVTDVSANDESGLGNMITRTVTISVNNAGGIGETQAATATVNGMNSAGSGTFEYTTNTNITATSSGTVTAINVPEGHYIGRDQTLITLGGDDLENEIQSSSDNLRNAELSMEDTQSQIDDYTITSPIDGTIVSKSHKAGESVESGSELCIIYDLSYLEMTLNVDELDIASVAVGQTVSITADAVEDQTFTGTVTEVSVNGTTDSGVTSYPVTIRIDDTDGLLPGMNVDAEIVLEASDNVLAIPSAAVVRDNLVLVTEDSPSAANAVEDANQEAPEGYVYVQVETGISDDTYVAILSGLQEGDTVAYVPPVSSEMDDMMMMGGPGMGGAPAGGGMSGPPSGGGMGGGGMGGGPGGGGGMP